MWWNSMPPWLQGAGMGQPMTPGAGMPPYSRAPMNMNPVQMGPPGAVPGAPPPGQPQQPLGPAQMGMLSALLSQQTRKPGDPSAGLVPAGPNGQPAPGQGSVTEPSVATGAMTGAAGSPMGMPAQSPGDLLGLLARLGIIKPS